MNTYECIAHSPLATPIIPAQSYASHVDNVTLNSTRKAKNAADAAPFASLFVEILRLASELHDLGKLDPLNQTVLHVVRGGKLPVNHVDAGVAELKRRKVEVAADLAALLIYSHHQGLPNFSELLNNKFRDIRVCERFGSIKMRTDEWLDRYMQIHRQHVTSVSPGASTLSKRPRNMQVMYRIALSCLVDADHFDTSLNYQQATPAPCVPLRPADRLDRLDRYVAAFGDASNERNRLRVKVYESCRAALSTRSIATCDSPVGSGKTTAVMAHLLRVAADNELRRIFVVLPFTNIITQSVDVYRGSLTLPDEDPLHVVAAHHHRAEFSDIHSRSLTYLWESPIVVTTAVQFFETLAAARTKALRKLHQLANSAIFIDESHAALPAHLWPIAWKWIRTLYEDWNCHIVLGSGSLSEFWTLTEFCDPPTKLSSIVEADDQSSSNFYEGRRIRYQSRPEQMSLEEIVEWVHLAPGPRLLIVNTVQSAAYIAHAMNVGGERRSVEHLSTSLTPDDRAATLETVKRRLARCKDTNWTLVATSCIEAGVDISFRTGFRERASLNSLLQTAGRVNRAGEYGSADVWDFQCQHDHRIRKHPAFEDSATVLGELFAENKVSPAYCTLAMQREIRRTGMKAVAEQLDKAEQKAQFVEVETLFRVINTDAVLVVVKKTLLKRLRNRENVSSQELQNGSVQIYSNRLAAFAVAPIVERPGIYEWTLKYDPFVGYMAGVLDNNEFIQSGGTFA